MWYTSPQWPGSAGTIRAFVLSRREQWLHGLLAMRYLAIQIGLITLGVGVFALVGWRVPQITAQQGVLLAFTVGALTIIPAILMGLGDIPGFWPQYFLVAFGMAAGSFLALLFVRLSEHLSKHD